MEQQPGAAVPKGPPSPDSDICVSPSWSDFGGRKKKKEKSRLDKERKLAEKEMKVFEKQLKKAREKESESSTWANRRPQSVFSDRKSYLTSSPMAFTAAWRAPQDPMTKSQRTTMSSEISRYIKPYRTSTSSSLRNPWSLPLAPKTASKDARQRFALESSSGSEDEYERDLITHAYHMTLAGSNAKRPNCVHRQDSGSSIFRPNVAEVQSSRTSVAMTHSAPPTPLKDTMSRPASPSSSSSSRKLEDHNLALLNMKIEPESQVEASNVNEIPPSPETPTEPSKTSAQHIEVPCINSSVASGMAASLSDQQHEDITADVAADLASPQRISTGRFSPLMDPSEPVIAESSEAAEAPFDSFRSQFRLDARTSSSTSGSSAPSTIYLSEGASSLNLTSPTPPSTRASSDDGLSLPVGASSASYLRDAANRAKRQPPGSSLRPMPPSRHRTFNTSSLQDGALGTQQQKPVAKMFVICCKCKFWHDLPSKVYEAMAMPRRILENEVEGAMEGEVDTVVRCPWCEHGMSTQCCAGWTTVVYLHERHH